LSSVKQFDYGLRSERKFRNGRGQRKGLTKDSDGDI
jgi:hypothetical protein